MTVRRNDSWQVKPGQIDAFKAQIRAFAEAVEPLGVGPITLIRVSSGGPAAGLFHAFADWESMEAYGEFMDKALNDESVQSAYGAMFEADAPAIPMGSTQFVKVAAFGADEPLNQPGVCAVVRTWSVPPGHFSVVADSLAKIADLYSHTNAHWNVWNIYAGGRGSGAQMLSAVVFPNMKELGAYVDDSHANPRVGEIIRETSSHEYAPKMLGASFVRAVAY